MQNSGLSKTTVAFGVALALAGVVNGLLVIAKETIPAVLAGMQKLTGHHWITQSFLVVGLFLFSGWFLGRANDGKGIHLTAGRLIAVLVAGVFTGALLIVGFYLVGD